MTNIKNKFFYNSALKSLLLAFWFFLCILLKYVQWKYIS